MHRSGRRHAHHCHRSWACGTVLAAALAQRGHHVTAVDRDPGPPPEGPWERRGVMEFHHAHAFRPTVVESLERVVPEAVPVWLATGAEPITAVSGGPPRLVGIRSRRDQFERALPQVAQDVPGFHIQEGHVERVLTANGRAIGLVVDGSPLQGDLALSHVHQAVRKPPGGP